MRKIGKKLILDPADLMLLLGATEQVTRAELINAVAVTRGPDEDCVIPIAMLDPRVMGLIRVGLLRATDSDRIVLTALGIRRLMDARFMRFVTGRTRAYLDLVVTPLSERDAHAMGAGDHGPTPDTDDGNGWNSYVE